MEQDNCLLCEIVLPEYKDTIIRLKAKIKHLEQIIEQLKNDSDSTRHSDPV